MAARRRRSIEQQLAGQAARQMMRTPAGRAALLVLALVVGVLWCGKRAWNSFLRPRHPVGPTVRLATWNLRQFSDRPNIDLRGIASTINQSHFDLVAIQEVKQDGEEVDRLLNVLGAPWRAASMSPMTGNHERFAFIYNGDHVQEVGRPHFIEDSDARVFDRVPYQETFRAGNFDFTLITVHLSYGDTQRRRREAEELASYAQRLAHTSSDKDVIVLGDFNEQGSGNLHFFEQAGWESLNHEPTNLSSSETYDTLLIDPRNTREWSGVSGAMIFIGNSETVSDHRPAYADFVTNLPDDD
jgi:endonuclease/exonuclease/phosphatase family metal-dependent hydrolase